MLLVTPGIVETESLKPVDVDLNQSSGFDAETQAIIDQAKQNQATGGNYGEMIENPYLLDPEAIAAFVEMGIDPTGKTAAELEAEVDTLIIKEGALTLFDPKDPLDYLAGGLMISGIGLKGGAAIKAVRTGKKIADSSKKISKYQKLKNLLNPFYTKPIKKGPTVYPTGGGAPYTQITIPTIKGVDTGKALMYGGAGVQYFDETMASNQLAEQAANIQKDIDKLKVGEVIAANKAIAEVKKNLEKQKENEVENVVPGTGSGTGGGTGNEDKRPSISDIFGTPQFDRFIRNVGSALVKTGQVGAGLAQGAAAAAEERAAEELALKLELIKASGKGGLSNELRYKMDKDYSTYASTMAENAASLNFLNQVENILSQTSVTGLNNLFKQYGYKFRALFNPNAPMDAKTEVENLLREISIGNADKVLGQASGRLSDKDIELATTLVGKLEGLSGATLTSDEILSIIARRRADLERDQAKAGTEFQRLEDRYAAAGEKPPSTDLFKILEALQQENQRPSKNEEEIDIKLNPGSE
jgi:hypothetical protein|tara:strand:- start:3255 stop:4841 length:1587 start_codon:yes stop_codon:yes gene_type:complete